MCGAALATAECNDAISGIFEHIGLDEPSRCFNQDSDLLFVEGRDLAERIGPSNKANLRLEDVAHAGDDFLVQQHIADLFIAACKQTRHYL